jgi:hypothetical protein
MKVRIYDIERETGAETFTGECELIEAFGDGARDPEYYEAFREIASVGRYWLGGGAAPLVLLMSAER